MGQITSLTSGVNGEAKITVSEPDSYLSIYGSGFLYPAAKGKSYDTGDLFKLVAEARDKINKKKFPDANTVVQYCPTDIDFFELINNQTNIKRLDVYCHGFAHGLNLGGFTEKRLVGGENMDSSEIDWETPVQGEGRDLRRVDIHENLYFPGSAEENELAEIIPDVFDSNVEVYFWGCNIGGQLSPTGEHILDNAAKLKDPKGSFAQKFAERIGKGSVYTLVGKGAGGGSVFKQDAEGRSYYDDGEMLPANIAANYNYKNTKQLNAMNHMKKFPL